MQTMATMNSDCSEQSEHLEQSTEALEKLWNLYSAKHRTVHVETGWGDIRHTFFTKTLQSALNVICCKKRAILGRGTTCRDSSEQCASPSKD